jgi:hypothetical protein
MKATFKTIPEFIDLLDQHNLSSDKIRTVLEKGFKIYANEELNPDQLKEQLKEYWGEYGHTNNKPILLDVHADIEEYLREQTHQDRKELFTVYKTMRAAKIASLHYNTAMHDNDVFLLGEVAIKFTS